MDSTRYTKDHEWIRIDGDTVIIGITNYAQEQLGDVVFVELPAVGSVLTVGDEVAVVESVKAASEVYAPASGQVVSVNEALTDNPALVNEDAEGQGWFWRMNLKDQNALEALMSKESYLRLVAETS